MKSMVRYSSHCVAADGLGCPVRIEEVAALMNEDTHGGRLRQGLELCLALPHGAFCLPGLLIELGVLDGDGRMGGQGFQEIDIALEIGILVALSPRAP